MSSKKDKQKDNQKKKLSLNWSRSLIFLFINVSLSLTLLNFIPFSFASNNAQEVFENDFKTQIKYQNGIESWLHKNLSNNDFSTGSKLFNGEWLFGTYLMSGLSLCQMVKLHPHLSKKNKALIEKCIQNLLSKRVKYFDKNSWSEDPIHSLGSTKNHHAAYLGYLNLLLSMNQTIYPNSTYNQLNDEISKALLQHLKMTELRLLETYPGERYPVDNAAVFASLFLYERIHKNKNLNFLNECLSKYKDKYFDPKTNLLIQAVDFKGDAIDEARGSGTNLAIYFLSFINAETSASLYAGIKKNLADSFFNFGLVKEYTDDVKDKIMDIDSGPIILSYGFSATGFCLVGSKIYKDKIFFKQLFATTQLFGAPLTHDNEISFITGGPLGSSILFAMLSACPEYFWENK